MPAKLRPTAPTAADAILVGDPGRALLLAQELLEQPKMSNHARGLWGYSGRSVRGEPLTIQATGMGGPSAALVLADLAELGVERAIRIGTAAALGERAAPGELLTVERAISAGGSSAAFGLAAREAVDPDRGLTRALAAALGERGRAAEVSSLDSVPGSPDAAPGDAADMQTVAVLARAAQLGVRAAALLIVAEGAGGELADEAMADAAKEAGRAAVDALSNPKVEG